MASEEREHLWSDKEKESAEESLQASQHNDEYDSTTDGSPPLTPILWIQRQICDGVHPLEVLQHLLGQQWRPQKSASELELWEIVLELLTRPPPRPLLSNVTAVADVVQLIKTCSNIIVLSGAGISVSCGIPDFRSPNGLYARLAQEFPELPDPQAMFDIHFFEDDPRPFFRFAKEILPGTYQPSISHKMVAALERRGSLLRNYTQNIDTLEEVAGITKVEYCHGSFSTASCCVCRNRVTIDVIRSDIMKEEVPLCPRCAANGTEGVMKPDIVFFGEGLREAFHQQIQEDKDQVDLLIVIGSSLKVRPVSLIPEILPSSVPQVLINKEPLPHVKGFDVRLLGHCDEIVTELCHQLGEDWLEEIGVEQPVEGAKVTQPAPRVFLFSRGIWTETPTEENAEQEEKEEEKETDSGGGEEEEVAKEAKKEEEEEEQISAPHEETDTQRADVSTLPSAKRRRTDD